MQKRFSNEADYLIYLIRCGINSIKPEPPSEEIDWGEFVALSKQQEVFSFIVCVLPFEYLPKEEAKKLDNYSKNELVKTLVVNNERGILEEKLNENKIDFMYLKGSVLKELYPKESMRQMSDIDILYNKSKRDELLELMKECDYKLVSWSENSDDFSKPPYCTFEFHRELFFDEFGFCPDFSFVWNNATTVSENPYKHVMSFEDVYLHCVAHMYKHYVLGGFGIRFLCDLYLLFTKKNLDFEYISKMLQKFEIADFERTVKELSIAIFEEKELTDEQYEFMNKVMSFGLFGEEGAGTKLKFDLFKEEYNTDSLFKYTLLRMFPKKEYMLRTYPVLEKKPFLLGYYYIERLITKTFSDGKRAKDELEKVKNIKNNESQTR